VEAREYLERHLPESEPESRPGTLGDVLYAKKGKPLVPEAEWVALVHGVARGNQPSLHRLYERAHHVVFTLALRITCNRETAEEVTLDVFHDLWRRAAAYDPANGTVLGWIMNQARSRSIDRVRFEQRQKRRGTPGDAPPAEEDEMSDPRRILELAQQGRALRAALEVLTPAEREAIECAFLSGLTHSEVAACLDEPLGTVKTRIRSGLRKLRQALAPAAGVP
jgi:RNA polymerase sigma-70 factor (ECF subfamily)